MNARLSTPTLVCLAVAAAAGAAAPAAADVLPPSAADVLPHSLEVWDNAARAAIPPGLRVWLGILVLTFLASLAFVRTRRAARWAIGGFIASHVLVVLFEASGIATLRTGLVSWSHLIGWTPALVALVRDLPAAPALSPYGAWCRMLVGIIAIAFVFDVRDAGMFLYHRVAGHPVFAALSELPFIG